MFKILNNELLIGYENCNYDEYIEILEIHHIDYNHNNNNLKNLKVLCPNCHSIEHIVKYGSNKKKQNKCPRSLMDRAKAF